MHTNTTTAARLAIFAGAVATAAALAILSADAFKSGHWDLSHVLMPAIVGITILSGHLFGTALRGWKLPSAAGFAVLFALGTGLTVYTSVGRQATTADQAMASAEAVNKELADKTAEVKAARIRRDQADTEATKEMTGQKCLSRCQAWKTRVADIQARIDILEAGIRRIGGHQVVAPNAERVANILAMIGYDKANTKAVFIQLEPFFYSLFFEIGALVAFGYGFAVLRGARRVKITPEPGPVVTADTSTSGQERRGAVVAFVAAQNARKGTLPTLAEVQAMHLARFGATLPKSTASRWRLEAAAIQPVKRLRVVG